MLGKRKIKPRRLQGFVYNAPIARRKKQDDPQKDQEKPKTQEAPTEESPPQSPTVTQQRSATPDPQPSPNLIPDPLSSDTIPTPTPNQKNNLDELLENIYRYKKSPVAYSSAIKKYIDQNYSLSLHKQRRKKFRRRPFLVYDPYDAIQADILFFNQPEFYYQNSHFKYILTVIDVFSKKANALPLKSKSASDVAEALDKIISEFPIIPRKLMVDAGTEFSGASNSIYNVVVQKYKVKISYIYCVP